LGCPHIEISKLVRFIDKRELSVAACRASHSRGVGSSSGNERLG
jgi:hypothetical protein